MEPKTYVDELTRSARRAAQTVAAASTAEKNEVLRRMAENILENRESIQEANRKDLEAGREAGLTSAMLDRLELTDKRIDGMATSLRKVAALKDPVGRIIDGWTLPNGMKLDKVRVPLGVVCMIFESRPNVTADAASLCLKSGNAVILRGGKEAIHSNLALHAQIQAACEGSSIDPDAVQMVNTPDREVVQHLMRADGYIDVIIPRGGKGLIRAVVENATIPVIKHYEGICHVYVDADADLQMAADICYNAKVQRPGVCNAMETMLVNRAVADEFFEIMYPRFREAGVELRGCPVCCEKCKEMVQATPDDWTAEYLDLILAVRVVSSVEDAIEHINRFGSQHTDSIVTNDFSHAQLFLDRVNSSSVFVNCSTRFSDGEQFGLGAEIGISTDKLHARGPMGLEELTTYKWRAIGNGQVRT